MLFREIATEYLESLDRSLFLDGMKTELVYDVLGEVNVSVLTTDDIQKCLARLYDDCKIRGSQYARYIKKSPRKTKPLGRSLF